MRPVVTGVEDAGEGTADGELPGEPDVPGEGCVWGWVLNGVVTGSTCLSPWQVAQKTGWWQYAQAVLPCLRMTAAWFVAIVSWSIVTAPVEWQFEQ